MIEKSKSDQGHLDDLAEIFTEARKNNLRFNPEKFTFGVRARKFPGFCLMEWGIEANPDKCWVVTEMCPPTSKKEVQKLTGMITAFSRFVSKASNRSLPFFKILKKGVQFQWTSECENALAELKQILMEPPILTRPVEEETLYLYLAVAKETLSVVLIRETEVGQKPIYFVSKVLQGRDTRYEKTEKVALALVMAARRDHTLWLTKW